jgi:hypothetical protein
LTTRDGAVTIDVDAADGADALAAPADEPQLQPLTPEELKTQWENVLALYTVSHRLIIGDDDTSSPRTPLTCVDLRRLPLRMRGPFAAAAGDFSDEESESDDSDDDGVAGAPLVTSPSVTAGDGAGDAAAGAAGAGAGAGVGRGRRRRVVDGVVGRVITHADAHRAGSMHMRVGALTVMRWGRIVRCRGGFNSDALLFPVGYCAHRVYWGPQRQYQRSVYVCEVLPRAVNATTPEQLEAVTVHAVGKRGRQQAVDAAVVPVFVITNLDDPSLRVEGVTHEGAECTDVVLAVCKSRVCCCCRCLGVYVVLCSCVEGAADAAGEPSHHRPLACEAAQGCEQARVDRADAHVVHVLWLWGACGASRAGGTAQRRRGNDRAERCGVCPARVLCIGERVSIWCWCCCCCD